MPQPSADTASPLRRPRLLRPGRIARRQYGLILGAFGAATTLALLIAVENYLAYQRMGRPKSLLEVIAHELPVWYVWLAVTPGIFWLARRLPVAGERRWRNLVLHLPLSAGTVFVTLVMITIVKAPVLQRPPGMSYLEALLHEYGRIFAVIMPIYFVILAVAHAVDSYRENEARARREAELGTLLERAQRDLLRMQLQPHFLFNTLHAVSALMERDVPAARRMLTRLSDLLRMALDDDSRHEVSVEEEIEFLDRYAEIQKIRFGGRLAVTYDVAADARRLLLPRLVLQPLVENAITHGLSRLERPGSVTVEARRRNGHLVLRVLDDGVGLEGGALTREGVGIGNTRARLEQLYGAGHRFAIGNLPEGGCEVRIEIPAGTEERTPSAPARNGAPS
ncbi:MAG TPA: histidine kinase [Longimicrobium sp.]|nr:histidine kinase [Longimicrobium sp.]